MASQTHLRFGKELEQLSIRDVEFLIENKIDESQNLEYKQPTNDLNKDCDELAKTISGFLNTDGGIIVFGISEEKDKEHRYPAGIVWCKSIKEHFESLLLNKVQPWEDRIQIYRIPSSGNHQNGIFILDIPKSDNPPHMFNFAYYRRLNFQTSHMSHQDVLRAFQTSWIDRRELNQSVIQPLYSEIKENCTRLAKYEACSSTEYDRIIHVNSYLYDRLDPCLRDKIADFYAKMNRINAMLTWKERITKRIINEELARTRGKVFVNKREQIRSNMQADLLQVNVKIRYPDRTINQVTHTLEGVLLSEPESNLRTYFQKGYHHGEIIDCNPILVIPNEKPIEISEYQFGLLWAECVSEAAKNKEYASINDETPKLLALGEEILALMSRR
jgi:hypothetical protein